VKIEAMLDSMHDLLTFLETFDEGVPAKKEQAA
jgi:hypothetical protein